MTAPLPPTQDPGARPLLRWLPVDRLTVDHRYQRTLESRRSQKLIENIAASFRWSAFQAILATGADNHTFLVIDGQHRVEAARLKGIAEVPAVVVDAGSLAEQAAAFVRANTDRVAVNNFALHHARLAAGDAAALALDAVCREAGVAVPRYPIPADKLKPGETLALGTIGKLTKTLPHGVAVAALRAVAAAYEGKGGGLRAPVIAATAALLAEAAPGTYADLAVAITAALKTREPAALEARMFDRKAKVGGTQVAALMWIIRHDIERARHDADDGESFIKPPTREQLMGRR